MTTMNEPNVTGAAQEKTELVELEEHARQHGTAAPPARRYAFRVDKDRVVVDTPTITGAEILAAVGKTPEQYKLYQHKRGQQPIPIPPDKVVDLREPGVERFTTMPRDTTEGREATSLRQDFHLPETDSTYLNGRALPWEAVLDGGSQWLIIHDWRVPSGYNHSLTKLGLLIPPSYSDAPLDMVYFSNHLARTDGIPIKNLSPINICGAQWQQWSRHRTQANPWRPGVDDIASHLALVDEWLRRELTKQ
jgi:hypothetical protein